MDTNITDSQAVAADLRVLAAQLDELQASLGVDDHEGLPPRREPAGRCSAGSCSSACSLWLAVPAIATIWLGWRWSRAARGG